MYSNASLTEGRKQCHLGMCLNWISHRLQHSLDDIVPRMDGERYLMWALYGWSRGADLAIQRRFFGRHTRRLYHCLQEAAAYLWKRVPPIVVIDTPVTLSREPPRLFLRYSGKISPGNDHVDFDFVPHRVCTAFMGGHVAPALRGAFSG